MSHKSKQDRISSNLGKMVELEMLSKLTHRHSQHGVIPAVRVADALRDVENDIDDFERSPTGDSTRNQMVLSIVRRLITERLRIIRTRLITAVDEGSDISIEALFSSK